MPISSLGNLAVGKPVCRERLYELFYIPEIYVALFGREIDFHKESFLYILVREIQPDPFLVSLAIVRYPHWYIMGMTSLL